MTLPMIPVRRPQPPQTARSPQPASSPASEGRRTYKMPDLGDLWDADIHEMPNGWAYSIAVITPDLAARILEANSDQQRRKKSRHIAQYARDMREGRWELTHQGIAFNRDARLVDGQNRCEASVLAEAPFATLVFFGVGGSDEMVRFDTGAARNAQDAAKVLGIDSASHTQIAVLRSFLYGPDRQRFPFTNPFMVEQLVRYSPMLRLVSSYPSSPLLPSGVRAAMGRALYHAGPDAINRFAGLLTDSLREPGPSQPGDGSVRAFRISQLSKYQFRTARDQRESYCRAQRALRSYLDGVDLQKVYMDEKDTFPLPTEQQLAETHAAMERLASE